jgi:hypothetical protein
MLSLLFADLSQEYSMLKKPHPKGSNCGASSDQSGPCPVLKNIPVTKDFVLLLATAWEMVL